MEIGNSKPKTATVLETWNCHCCSAKNTQDVSKCKVCGRHESYALQEPGNTVPSGIAAKKTKKTEAK